MEILKDIVARAKAAAGTVIFAEGDEERTLAAAARLAREKVCKAVLVAKKNEIDASGITFLEPDTALIDGRLLTDFVERRMKGGMSEGDARRLAAEPLHFSALYVASGRADAGIAGARSDTANVLRAALRGVGTPPGAKFISSFFLMVPPEGHPLVKDPLMYADCAVNPAPDSAGLKDVAIASIENFKKIFPEGTARVAFLSFSTKGSAEHETLKSIRAAAAMARERYFGDGKVHVDGELQFDAAVVPGVGERKAPGSDVAGKANILIFPDLNAGNIGYKITERLGLFKAIGPVTQGLARPMSDLSRGCTAEDIYYTTALLLLGK